MTSLSDEPQSLLTLLPNVYRAFYGAFSHLHPVQKQAAPPILRGSDLIVQSRTGSGKTEAVLAPCVEQVIRSGREKAILFIVPTRALAIDLERRLTPVINGRLGLRISLRTGDVKRPGGERPDILLTTPESLDVSIGSTNEQVREFLKRISIIVIDEIHPLLHTYRGKQLVFLLLRLELLSGRGAQKVAISATIADPDDIISFFQFSKGTVKLLTTESRAILPRLVHIKKDEPEFISLTNDLYERWGYKKILIFANSRACCDRLFELLGSRGKFLGVCELHYSNLKSRERKGVENRFRGRDHSLCVSTSTLELGIDVGNVDAVILYEPPDSVSAFLQRVGRSNRRERKINFWGVCRGENPGKQLLRFLALIDLSERGVIEAPPEKNPVSCLIQQILSCLYEKREISIVSLKKLFPDHAKEFDSIFAQMEKQGWLKRERKNKLFRGGWRYGRFLVDKKIWSNFPESEEEYTLVVLKEAIADLPAPLVRQLDIGDRVQLAGKRIRITGISYGPGKRVQAEPCNHLDKKDLFWVGAGFHISYEVAQAVRDILKTDESPKEADFSTLFSRTKKLFREEIKKSGRVVKLANGVELTRTLNGLFQYRTFLGSVGNLILQRSIQHFLSVNQEEAFSVTFDEIGVFSSHRVNFHALDLPVDKGRFRVWAKRHKKALEATFPVNVFYNFLPPELKTDELLGFIFDPRLASTFAGYLSDSSDIVEGDPELLNMETPDRNTTSITFIETKGEPLLEKAKRDFTISRPGNNTSTLKEYSQKNITGTLVGEFIRLNQCDRCLSYHFLPAEKHKLREDPLKKRRVKKGEEHEKKTISFLETKCSELTAVAERNTSGKIRPLKERFEESVRLINKQVSAVIDDPEKSFTIMRAVLSVPSNIFLNVSTGFPSLEINLPGKTLELLKGIAGVGIPDIIFISMKNGKVLVETGDIKGSAAPRYYQKWQVAYYSILINCLVDAEILHPEIKAGESGFLITSPCYPETDPVCTGFALAPYFLTFPSLLKRISRVLACPPDNASFQLSGRCTTCGYFESCYGEALREEEVQFLYPVTKGTIGKLRSRNIRTLEQVEEWFSQDEKGGEVQLFSPGTRERLKLAAKAFSLNKIGVSPERGGIFPENISDSIFFHVTTDPVTGMPLGLGIRTPESPGVTAKTRTWIITEEKDFEETWNDFLAALKDALEKNICQGRESYLFLFGRRSLEAVLKFDREKKVPIETQKHRVIDLNRVFSKNFAFPAPGGTTLFALSHLLGFESSLKEPETLLHTDPQPFSNTICPDADFKNGLEDSIQNILEVQEKISRWACVHLKGGTENESPAFTSASSAGSTGSLYIRFIEEERRAKEEELLALQSYPLQERVARFRAIGPISFLHAALDEHGSFLYIFQIENSKNSSKFRDGDFLRLCPAGITNHQEGMKVILAGYNRRLGQLEVRSREGRLSFNQQIHYSLEEESTDWNTPRLKKIVETVFSAERSDPLHKLFFGSSVPGQTLKNADLTWVDGWLKKSENICGLNIQQRRALRLPFQYSLSLIEGPPGTGKTHLLGWIIIALLTQAKESAVTMRIAVSALTHEAIDNVLKKISQLIRLTGAAGDFSGQCFKLGRFENFPKNSTVKPLERREDLLNLPYAVVGSTGFGLHQLFEGEKGKYPKVFDWVMFDEASQILLPQALLSMVYGKSRFLFIGDVRQLGPVISGPPSSHVLPDTFSVTHQSVLSHLLGRFGKDVSVQLRETYRMNKELARFPGMMWYKGNLRAAPDNENSRLVFPRSIHRQKNLPDTVLSPEKPVALVLVKHENCHQQSRLEAQVAAEIAFRLIAERGLRSEQLAILSPHRAQNDMVASYLSALLNAPGHELPFIDTVERMQGGERDVVIFSFTSSDPDVIESDFLNSPNRFNVAITRARHKLIVIGSELFFQNIAHTENAMKGSYHIKAFYEYCLQQNALFNKI